MGLRVSTDIPYGNACDLSVGAAGGLVRLFLLASYAWQLALEGSKWLLGSKRGLRAERVRAYWWVLKSGL